MTYRSWAEIDINKLEKNIKNIYRYVNKYIFAVVKADAYGHGSVEISKYLESIPYVKKLCVATAEEGKELREAGVEKDILVLGGILEEEIDCFDTYGLQPVVSDFSQLNLVKKLKNKRIHIKFDTGMHRLGFYKKDICSIVETVKGNSIEIEGVMSHFPSADIDRELTEKQIEKLNEIIYILESKGITPSYTHIQNSAGLIYECPFCNAVRIGLAIYGEKPVIDFPVSIENVMSVKAKIVSIKELRKGDKVSYCGTFIADRSMKAGVVSFGYADGLPRELSNKGYFLINGKKARIIGNVTMDMTIVDITGIDVKEGDTVVVIGESFGERIKFSDVANLCNTIPYEIMCRVSKRVKRVVKSEKKENHLSGAK